MNIVTKSLQLPKKPTDGLRVCVMRRIKPEYTFDMWIPQLAPSEKLLSDYVINKKITWEQFVPKYQKEITRQKKLIRSVVQLSRVSKVTLLCWEKSARRCHRSLLLAACKAA